ncbi:GtrA family protein [Bacillus sp. Marseille-Q1617]|uniref:GtrA family protein n=1 Tax=Bacillus sp. Marseille-Q1617 TaxID=2736887 RepID=UPI00158E54C9|nr:GtrA family protein [Bacillus sp. Marseille-Q1617]
MKMFLKFGTVGFFNTLITLGSYTLFIYIGINYLAANVLGYFLGVLNSYYWNKKWVFRDRTKKASVFFKFITVNILTLTFNTFTLYILVDQLGFHPVIANVFAVGAGLALNYIMNVKWTFNQPS